MRRREFIAGIGSAAAWPMVARSQQRAMSVVGYIGAGVSGRDAVAFAKGLKEEGYVEGRNVAIEYRLVQGRNERRGAFVEDLVQRRVDVIAAIESTAVALAAKAATRTIPIVFRIAGDAVAAGLVMSLNRPGGNVTGVTTLGNELASKQLQTLREMLPANTAVAALVNPANPSPSARGVIDELQVAARLLSVRLIIFNVSSPNDIDAAYANFDSQAIGGVLAVAEPLFFAERGRLIALAARRNVPALYSDRLFVQDGGLMSYGSDLPEGWRQAGIYTGRILKGEKPADLPVQQSTKLELVVNLKTARLLGLTIPETLLATADEVVQ
jgi:putative tryptophan/tyrosine transport system substrate-binding protein